MNSRWFFVLFLILALVIGFFIYNRYHTAPGINFNDLVLVDMEGQPFEFSSLAGKKTVVCFSASWCGACWKELDDLKKIYTTELQETQIVVIDDEPIEKARAFRDKKEYPFLFLKMQGTFNDLGVYSIPVSYLMNRNLEVKKETVGFINWKDLSTRQHLLKIME